MIGSHTPGFAGLGQIGQGLLRMATISVMDTSSEMASGPIGIPALSASFSMRAAGIPSPSMACPSLVKVPNTREVKNPRESLTTMGVLPKASTVSNANARVSSEVFAPRMSSTNGIRCTGEKKCMPTNIDGSGTASASPVMGRVEVFDAIVASGAAFTAPECTPALTPRSSNTASITRSQPATAETSSAVVTSARVASRLS